MHTPSVQSGCYHNSLYPPIRQDAVLLTNGAHNHVAQAFLSYLKSPEALTIITAYGYATP
jgi:molybdate transport system substrate-binding protein